MNKRYDAGGQRMTNCCAAFATYGPNVTLANLDTVRLKCAECGRLTTAGEGDGTEYLNKEAEKFQDDFFAALGEDDPIAGAGE